MDASSKLNIFREEKESAMQQGQETPLQICAVMEMQKITIRVTTEAARIYQSASDSERRKLDALLSLQIRETAQPSRPLKEVMRDASEEAQARGLTQELLKEMLDEP